MAKVKVIYTHQKSQEEIKESVNKLLNKFLNELMEKNPDIDYATYFS